MPKIGQKDLSARKRKRHMTLFCSWLWQHVPTFLIVFILLLKVWLPSVGKLINCYHSFTLGLETFCNISKVFVLLLKGECCDAHYDPCTGAAICGQIVTLLSVSLTLVKYIFLKLFESVARPPTHTREPRKMTSFTSFFSLRVY